MSFPVNSLTKLQYRKHYISHIIHLYHQHDDTSFGISELLVSLSMIYRESDRHLHYAHCYNPFRQERKKVHFVWYTKRTFLCERPPKRSRIEVEKRKSSVPTLFNKLEFL